MWVTSDLVKSNWIQISFDFWMTASRRFEWLHHDVSDSRSGSKSCTLHIRLGFCPIFNIKDRFHDFVFCDSNLRWVKFPYHIPFFSPGVNLFCLACWCPSLSMRSRLNGRNAMFWNDDDTFGCFVRLTLIKRLIWEWFFFPRKKCWKKIWWKFVENWIHLPRRICGSRTDNCIEVIFGDSDMDAYICVGSYPMSIYPSSTSKT